MNMVLEKKFILIIIFLVIQVLCFYQSENKSIFLNLLQLKYESLRITRDDLALINIDYSFLGSHLKRVIEIDLNDSRFRKIFQKLKDKGCTKIQLMFTDKGFSSYKTEEGGVIYIPENYVSLPAEKRKVILEHEFWEVYIAHKYLKEREEFSRLLGEIGRFYYEYNNSKYGILIEYIKALADTNVMCFQIKEGFVEEARNYAQEKFNETREKIVWTPEAILNQQFIQVYILTVFPFEIRMEAFRLKKQVYEDDLTQLKEIYRDYMPLEMIDKLITDFIVPLKNKHQKALEEGYYYPRRSELEKILFTLVE